MITKVFECPECHHICEQDALRVKRPAADGFEAEKDDILWQCGNCLVIYTDRYRWLEEKRRNGREEKGWRNPACG